MKSKIIKRFAGIMAFLMLATQISIPVMAQDTISSDNSCSVKTECFSSGDVNGDCVLSAADSLAITTHMNSGDDFDACYDVNSDGVVSAADSLVITENMNSGAACPSTCTVSTNASGNDDSSAGSNTESSTETGTDGVVADDFELPPDSTTGANTESVSGAGQAEDVPVEDVSLSEEVDVDNVIDVLTDDLDEVTTDAGGGNLVDEALEDVVESLENESESEVEDALGDIEEDIQDAIDELTQDTSIDADTKAKILKKIAHLKAFYIKVKAKLLKKHAKLIKKVIKAKQLPKIYEIRWGNITGKRQRCTGLNMKDLRDSLASGEIPEKCLNEAKAVEYSGKISVDKGTLKVHKKVLFEENDKVTDETGTAIAFDSTIAGHWDGLIVEYTPDDDQDTKASITISIGELEETYVGEEVLGRKKIGNGHMIEIKHLAKVMKGVAKGIQNKLLKNKLKLQEKVTNMRGKLDRLRLMNKGGDGADELDDLLDEAGEYNFDDETAAEVEAAVSGLVSSVTDGANSEVISDKAKEFKKHLKKLKEKAKSKKFRNKMIPFKDTDDDQWYTDYVSSVKEEGIISGYKDAAGNELGEFRPGNNITVAEILKIGLETAGKGKAKGKMPNMTAAMNHWAKEYVAHAEQLDLDLVEGNVDLNRPATRSEVVRMMLEALGIEPDEITETSFSDLPKLHKNAAFVEYAKDLGIVSGDANATTFRPDAPVNRAEAAKIADQILGIIIGGWDSIGGDEPWE